VAQEFKLPELGEGVEQGDVVQVLVAEGDQVKPEQPVLEIETDKAVVEVPCPYGGRISKIHVKQGDQVKVGQTLVTVESDGQAAEAAPAEEKTAARPEAPEKPAAKERPPTTEAPPKEAPAPKKKAAAAPSKAPAPEPESREPKEEAKRPAAKTGEPEEKKEPLPSKTAEPTPPKARSAGEEPVPAGPATRRLARELGVDLHEVAAARPGARLTEQDVKEYVKFRMTGGIPAGGGPLTMPPLPDFSQWGPVERVAISSLQRKTAELLLASWTGPHVTQFDEADITALEALRQRHRDRAGESGVRLTVTAFVVKAVALALKQYPQFNMSYDVGAGELVYKRYYHIGVAVDTRAGLLVPVIRDADSKRVLDIAAEIAEIAERTRQRKVTREEMRGGTFTVTNLGGIGGTAFTPIINYPEVAILGLSRAREQPVLRDGALATRLMLPLCLSYDHRIVNGADGARFVRRLATLLEDPELLLLEA